MSRLLRRLTLVLLVVPLLAAHPLGAATPRQDHPREVRSAPSDIGALVSKVWGNILEWREKAGSSTDPFGVPSLSGAEEKGSSVDPSGHK
jgi:hypothetical protein